MAFQLIFRINRIKKEKNQAHSLFLKISRVPAYSPLSAYPIFDPVECPTASSKWQPPYPYTSGSVRWSMEGLPGHGGTHYFPETRTCKSTKVMEVIN
jgi:hypothetical protein